MARARTSMAALEFHREGLLFVQVRSIWLPSNPVLVVGVAIGLIRPVLSTVLSWTATLIALRHCEETVLGMDEDVRADRRATPMLSLPLPAIVGCTASTLARTCASFFMQ